MPTLDELCEALLKHPNIMEVNTTPMWSSHKYLPFVVNVKCWSERWQEHFWTGMPFSLPFIEVASIELLTDIIMRQVQVTEEVGPPSQPRKHK